jgi:hypothetical protein
LSLYLLCGFIDGDNKMEYHSIRKVNEKCEE